MRLKKAQIQMAESITIIFIFIVLVGFGLIFYMNVTKSTSSAKKEESSQLETIELVQKAAFLPELQCSGISVIKQNCMDMLKLNASEKIIIENQIYYYDTLGYSKISVKEIYPGTNTWMIYNYSLDGAEKKSTYKPILLYNPIDKLYHFGLLEIGVYFK